MDAWAKELTIKTRQALRAPHRHAWFGGLVAAVGPWLVATLKRKGIDWWWQLPFWFRGFSYAALTLVSVAFGGVTQKFIYFDF